MDQAESEAPPAEQVLEIANALLRQFIDPEEDFVTALCGHLEVPLPEDLHDWHGILTRALRPLPGDYAQVFRPGAAERAQRGYAPLWEPDSGTLIAPARHQTALRVVVATAHLLSIGDEVAALFPGGYRQIAGELLPERCWVVWEFLAPDEDQGMQHNGLVYLPHRELRFAWFPKPWRVLVEP